MDRISFVILHYKDTEVTDACVRSILRMEQRDRLSVVLVDNDVGEAPGVRKRLLQKYLDIPEVTVLQVKENGGFSHANNLGYALARKTQKASFIVAANNDIVFLQPDFPKRLDEAYRAHPCGVLAPDVVARETGEHQNPLDTRLRTAAEAAYTQRMNRFALRFYEPLYPVLYWQEKRAEKKRLMQRRELERASFFSSVQEDIVPFGALLIYTPDFVRREEKAFWPETPFYYEEYLLACRCQRAGCRIVYTPQLCALHGTGAATKKRFAGEKQRMRFRMERTAEASGIYLDYLKRAEETAVP